MHLPNQHDFVYLASQSPRRVQLLDQLGVKHKALQPGSGENAEALEEARSREREPQVGDGEVLHDRRRHRCQAREGRGGREGE